MSVKFTTFMSLLSIWAIQTSAETPKATSVTISNDYSSITAGETIKLSAVVEPYDACQTVEWFTDYNDIFTVNQDGTITCKGAGIESYNLYNQYRIYARTTDGTDLMSFIDLTVYPPYPESVSIHIDSSHVQVGDVVTPILSLTPSNACILPGIWTSSNPEIAQIYQSQDIFGNHKVELLGIKPGKSLISWVCEYQPELTASCEISVREKRISGITIDRRLLNIAKGSTYQLNATAIVEDPYYHNYNTKLSWKTSNPDVVDVSDNGLVTAVSAGHAEISVLSTDGSDKKATCLVSIIDADDVAMPNILIVSYKNKTDDTYLLKDLLSIEMSQKGELIVKTVNKNYILSLSDITSMQYVFSGLSNNEQKIEFNVEVRVEGHEIRISGDVSDYMVYAMTGHVVASGKTPCTIKMEPGIYFLKVAGQVYKIKI